MHTRRVRLKIKTKGQTDTEHCCNTSRPTNYTAEVKGVNHGRRKGVIRQVSGNV